MRRACPRYGAEIPCVDGAVQILVDESAQARYLPARQSAGSGVRRRTALDFRLQDR
jgi:hypothetical protein